jgi:hypothetical protein
MRPLRILPCNLTVLAPCDIKKKYKWLAGGYPTIVTVRQQTVVLRRMPSPAMWRSVGLVITDVSEERVVPIFRAEKIRERRKSVCQLLTLSLVCGFFTLKMEATRSSETSVLKRPTQRHIPEDGILDSHRCEYLKSYRQLSCYYAQLVTAPRRRAGNWGITSCIANCGIRWKWAWSFTLRPIFAEKEPLVRIGWEAIWVAARIWMLWKTEIYFTSAGNRIPIPRPSRQ